MNKVLTEHIDSHPYTGERNIKGYLKLSTKKYLDNFFDGSVNYQQVENITRGKIYEVISVIGYGDGEDVVILKDYANVIRGYRGITTNNKDNKCKYIILKSITNGILYKNNLEMADYEEKNE